MMFVRALFALVWFLIVGALVLSSAFMDGGPRWLLPVVFSVVWVTLSVRWAYLILRAEMRGEHRRMRYTSEPPHLTDEEA